MLAAAIAGLLVGGMAVAAPANAVGSGSWNCALYNSFNGQSSKSGSNYTSGGAECGNAQVSLGYTVSGGTALWTAYKSAAGLISAANPGYPVFAGHHKMSGAAPAFNVVRTT